MRALNTRALRRYFNEEIAGDVLLEIELLALTVAAGIDDAALFPDFHIFASNQTGNTVLIAVGALGIAGNVIDLRTVGFSLGLFIIGAISFGQLGEYIGRKKRGWLFVSNVLQTLMVFAAAALRKWYFHAAFAPHAWAMISLLAFQSGGQVAMARTVDVPEITTAMATSAYIDFMVDPDLFQVYNRPRNRRFFFIASLLGGSFIGATAYRQVEPALALLLCAIVKALVCIALLFNHAAPEKIDGKQNFITLEDGKDNVDSLEDGKEYFDILKSMQEEYKALENAKQMSYRRYGILYGR